MLREKDALALINIAETEGMEGLLKIIPGVSNVSQLDAFQLKIPYKNQTPLHLAIEYNKTKAAKALINFGVNVSVKDKFGWTPLHYAAKKNNIEILMLLINKEPKAIDNLTSIGETPLTCAVRKGNVDAVVILLNHHADINKTGRIDLRTPLHLAAASIERFPLVKILINYGANIEALNDVSHTPLLVAISRACVLNAFALINAGATVPQDNYPLKLLITNATNPKQHSESLIPLLIKEGATFNFPIKENNNAANFLKVYNIINPIFDPALLQQLANCIEYLFLLNSKENHPLLNDQFSLLNFAKLIIADISEDIYKNFAEKIEAARKILGEKIDIEQIIINTLYDNLVSVNLKERDPVAWKEFVLVIQATEEIGPNQQGLIPTLNAMVTKFLFPPPKDLHTTIGDRIQKKLLQEVTATYLSGRIFQKYLDFAKQQVINNAKEKNSTEKPQLPSGFTPSFNQDSKIKAETKATAESSPISPPKTKNT